MLAYWPTLDIVIGCGLLAGFFLAILSVGHLSSQSM